MIKRLAYYIFTLIGKVEDWYEQLTIKNKKFVASISVATFFFVIGIYLLDTNNNQTFLSLIFIFLAIISLLYFLWVLFLKSLIIFIFNCLKEEPRLIIAIMIIWIIGYSLQDSQIPHKKLLNFGLLLIAGLIWFIIETLQQTNKQLKHYKKLLDKQTHEIENLKIKISELQHLRSQ